MLQYLRSHAPAISTSKVLLVPYEGHHVAKYHSWMQDPVRLSPSPTDLHLHPSNRSKKVIREATASEPLSLEAEYRNQVSWRRAHDKLTFIVCKPIDRSLDGRGDIDFIRMNTLDRMEQMVGDVNFFLHPYDGDDDAQGAWLTGEVDIMIADQDSRRVGMGRAAVCAVLVYVQVQLGFMLEEYVMNGPKDGQTGAALKGLVVKIKEGNQASRGLFEKLGFRQEGGVNYFGEVKMVMGLADLQSQPWWEQALADWIQVPYGGLADELKYS